MKTCFFCNKKPAAAGRLNKLRGKFNPAGKRTQRPNLQWVRLDSNKKVLACSKCIKALSKTK